MVVGIKRNSIVVMCFAVVFLFISSAAIVPQVNSKPIIEKFESIDQSQENVVQLQDFLPEKIVQNGLFEWLIQLIQTLIQLVFKLIEVVQNIISIIHLIENLIDALQILFQLIQQLIELIQDIIPNALNVSTELFPEIKYC